MEKANLEFYERAYHLRENFSQIFSCRHCGRCREYRKIIDQLVSIYFQNGNKFPDTLEFQIFRYNRLSIIQSILDDLGFFDENHPISSYKFTRKVTGRIWGANQWHNDYKMTISQK